MFATSYRAQFGHEVAELAQDVVRASGLNVPEHGITMQQLCLAINNLQGPSLSHPTLRNFIDAGMTYNAREVRDLCAPEADENHEFIAAAFLVAAHNKADVTGFYQALLQRNLLPPAYKGALSAGLWVPETDERGSMEQKTYDDMNAFGQRVIKVVALMRCFRGMHAISSASGPLSAEQVKAVAAPFKPFKVVISKGFDADNRAKAVSLAGLFMAQYARFESLCSQRVDLEHSSVVNMQDWALARAQKKRKNAYTPV